MRIRIVGMVLSMALLLAGQVLAQGRGANEDRARGQRPSGSVPSVRAPEIFRGGPRPPMGWNDFHHDTAPAKVAPHRYGSTNLPRPNSWHGNVHDFDLANWQHGGWQHVRHNGRLGWWWVVGTDWNFFADPVYPYPDLYTPANMPFGWWYWCDSYQEYYPYVTYCPLPWESVMPMD
jgi:hypothetical protein